MKCPRCQAENDDRLQFCEDCGAPLTRACPRCGAQVHPGKKFCGECGAILDGAPVSQPAAPKQYTPQAPRRKHSAVVDEIILRPMPGDVNT
ncbi:MAG: double zinc ribbon domain-containing protein [Betaproteobacteria bacterium]